MKITSEISKSDCFSTIKVFPTILFSLLSCAVFYLPADECEKITLCISVLLSLGNVHFFTVLMDVHTNIWPPHCRGQMLVTKSGPRLIKSQYCAIHTNSPTPLLSKFHHMNIIIRVHLLVWSEL